MVGIKITKTVNITLYLYVEEREKSEGCIYPENLITADFVMLICA